MDAKGLIKYCKNHNIACDCDAHNPNWVFQAQCFPNHHVIEILSYFKSNVVWSIGAKCFSYDMPEEDRTTCFGITTELVVCVGA